MRVTQYNALAQCYVRSAQFPHSPSSALTTDATIPPSALTSMRLA